jgi:acylglycerol lipase
MEVTIKEEWVKVPGAELYSRTWTPVPASLSYLPIIATVLFVHGLGEHCERYDHVFSAFAAQGIKVLSYDQRGFGKTGRKAGIIGHSEGINVVNTDIKAMSALIRTKDVPHFIMGHSMGGFLALQFVAAGYEQFDGVIASAPLTKMDPEPPMVQKYAIQTLGYFMPSLAVSNGLVVTDLSRGLGFFLKVKMSRK